MVKQLLKGFVIGIANILPGVSGGTMMVSMGIYDKLIHCINHFFSEFKKNLSFILPIFFGIAIAIVLSTFGLEFLFRDYPVQTNMLFIGLILGGLPSVGKNLKGKVLRRSHIFSFVLFFSFILFMALLSTEGTSEVELTLQIPDVIKLFFVGIIASATMVIPGISGSMILLLLGYYNPILQAINDVLRALMSIDVAETFEKSFVLIPFGVGVVLGTFIIAKLMGLIFDRYREQAFCAIIGLILSSPITIIVLSDFGDISFLSVITGIITFVVGIVLSLKL